MPSSTPRLSYTPYQSTFKAEDIYNLYVQRKLAQGPDIARMREIQAIMNNELVLPLPELNEDERPAVANLAQQGMAQLARRIASVDPVQFFPSLNPGDEQADRDANDRQRLMTHWQQKSFNRVLKGKRGRQFLAYACAPVVLKPCPKENIPKWYSRDPLWTFPAPTEFGDCHPSDCIFVTRHPYSWLVDHYPEAANAVSKPDYWDMSDPDMNCEFDVLEYISADECRLILCGYETQGINGDPNDISGHATCADMLPPKRNFAGTPLAVVPGSVNLDDQLGHFDGIIGMYQAQAALMAITIVAQRRAVWPREWAVSNPNEQVEVITTPDPKTGSPGQIRGGKIEAQHLDPSMSTMEVVDRLEHAQRQTASLPPEFGGMSGTNIRTGRRGSQVLGTTIDFTIAEAQDVFAMSQYIENKVAIAIDKGYFPKKKSIFLMTRSYHGNLDYTPSKLWTSDEHIVEYPIAGVDIENLPVEGGQRVAMRTMSRIRFMEIDPAIPDAQAEERRIVLEDIRAAELAMIATLASTPDAPFGPVELANFEENVYKGMPIYKAIQKLQQEAQERQATPTEEPTAQQPGLSLPGTGMEQPPAIPENEPSMQNLTALLNGLGSVQMAQKFR